MYGYGRINVYEMLKAVRDGRIPPEAMIDGPSWFDVLPATGTVAVTGKVARHAPTRTTTGSSGRRASSRPRTPPPTRGGSRRAGPG